jgi:tetratricopeptide (TPR) repeat protein
MLNIYHTIKKMDFKTIKAHIDDFVYNNSHDAYGTLSTMFRVNTILSTVQPIVQCQVCGYIDSLKAINSNGLILFAELYYYGFYVKQEHKKAAEMYAKTIAIDNNRLGHFNIAYMYQYGNDLDKNIDMAIKHFTIAANAGCPLSQYHLGMIYTTTDIHKATEWYEMASMSKYYDSLHKLAKLYITTDILKSIGYYKLAIEQGKPNVKKAFDEILQENKNFATINNQSNEIAKLKEENNALKIQIEELELMPEGPKYKEAKEHFNLLAKSSGGLE